jgi:hypothetical protein
MRCRQRHRLGSGRWWRVKASTVVRNDGAEAPERTRRRCRGSEEDSTTARAPRRSMTAQTLGKFSLGNFGSLTA